MYDIDKIRRKEYPDLDKTCYLDYGGATPYARSLVDTSAKLWKSGLYGNPHSNSSSSLRATEYVEQARRRVLEFFRADEQHFDVVFVANATAAIKLVAYSFQEKGFWYGYHTDAHTSLVGIRELADAGYHCFSSDTEVEKWIESIPTPDQESSGSLPDQSNPSDCSGHSDQKTLKLIGYPAQSNMNGHRPPKEWTKLMRQKSGASDGHIYTLLDAAAYCSSAQLDLSVPDAAPDFTSVSFYKIFGMPDLGALIVRKKSSGILTSRRYFGGGTVDMVIAFDHFHAPKKQKIHEMLEDGTVPFHSLVMLDTGIVLHKRLFHSMDEISEHVSKLTHKLYMSLSQLRHGNGRPVCKIYQDEHSKYGDRTTQGPTVAFNICKPNGAWVHYDHVEALASACNIQIRTGGVCNPGGIAGHLNLENWEMRRNYCEGFRCGQPFKIRRGKPIGIVRASLGAMSNQRDVDTLVAFVEQFFVDNPHPEHGNTVVGKTLAENQQVWTMKYLQIFPIRHCPAWVLPPSQAWELEHSRLAMDGEWCLVDPQTEKIVDDRTLTKNLTIGINVELGRLCFRTSNPGSPLAIEVNLWELPTGDWVFDSLEQVQGATYRMARRFVSTDVERFFTLALGRPTTLARFFESTGDLPINFKPQEKKTNARPNSSGINVQFSGDVPQPHVHVLLNGGQRNAGLNGKHPQLLQIGNQKLIKASWTDEECGNIYEDNIAKYYRLPDVEESLASQNTAVRHTDLVVGLGANMNTETTISEECHFCPVINCQEKNFDYSIFLEHLTSHSQTFVQPRRRRCWFR